MSVSTQVEARPPVASPYLTKDEAAAYSRTSRSSVQRAVRDGLLEYFTVGHGAKARKVFTREQLDAWVSGETRRRQRVRLAPEPVPVDPRSRQRRRPA